MAGAGKTAPARRAGWGTDADLSLLAWVGGLGLGFAAGLSTAMAAMLPKYRSVPAAAADAADTPLEISPRGWRRILGRTLRECNQDQIPAVAAGATFFALLSIFPALGAFVALYGLFADVDAARRQIAALAGLLPTGALTVMEDQITRVAAQDHGRLGITFVLSLLVSLWASNAGLKALLGGLNIAYDERERRGFIALNLVSLTFTLGCVIFMVVATTAIAAAPDTLVALHVSRWVRLSLLRWPILLLVVMGLLSLLYRYGPCRRRARWRWVTPGSGLAAIGWMISSLLFSWYVANFGHYDRTYGSLGAVVGFMTWIWLSLIVVLFGAELNSEIEPRTPARP